jgi:hypothetical protein
MEEDKEMKTWRIITKRFTMDIPAETKEEAERIFRDCTHNRRGEDIVEVKEVISPASLI